MKTSIKELEPCRKQAKVEVGEQKISETFDEVYKYFSKNMKIPGFRAGKVPKSVLAKLHYKSVKKEVMNRVVEDACREVIEENKLRLLKIPNVRDVDFSNDKKLIFKVDFELKPDVKFKKYKRLSLKKPKINVTDEEVNKALAGIQEKHAKLNTIKNTSVSKDNVVVCDLECLVDETVIDKREGVLIDMKYEDDKFVKSLFGGNVGETKRVETNLPEDYSDKQYAGKKALFKITIKEVRQKQLPELNDEFAKALGKYEKIAELKEDIKKNLLAEKEFYVRKEMEEEVIEKLIDTSTMVLPASILEAQLNKLVEDAKQQQNPPLNSPLGKGGNRGLKNLQIQNKEGKLPKNDHKDLRNQYKPIAEKQVKAYFIIDNIAELENIKVTEQEIRFRLAYMAGRLNMDDNQFKEYLKDEKLIADVEYRVLREKVLGFLIKEAEVTES